jgi:para-aminobenzoate synthetase component 1
MKHTIAGTHEPIWQEFPFEDPAHVARRLRRREKFTFLDSAMSHDALGRYAYLAFDPCDTVLAREDAPLRNVEEVLAKGRLNHVEGLPPFQGGLCGYISYEFGRLLEPILVAKTPAPTIPPLQLHIYDVVAAFDLARKSAFVISTGYPETDESARISRARRRLDEVLSLLDKPSDQQLRGVTPVDGFRSNFTRAQYEDAVRRTIEYVLAGDIFQANIAQRFAAPVPENFDAFAFYENLRNRNAATFSVFFDYGDVKVCSSSPERLMSCDGTYAEARPIKGTRRRVSDSRVDAILKSDLLASRKDRAENIMIVDLLRNDLSRVCEPGSVEVPVLCGLESYASVHHLVSVVTGKLSPGRQPSDLIAACFPGGSITGAPKVRAMEIIGELERTPRNIYCGSIGFMSFSGRMDFNIAIRTVTFHDGVASFHGGGGITARSDPSAEFDETIAKVQRIMEAFRQP